jgi:hypothetical protein
MIVQIVNLAKAIWNWAKANDLPNWGVVLFTAIVWPSFLYYWHSRKVNNIPNLEVRLAPGNMQINGEQHDAVAIDIINHTGAVVYLSGARIKRCSRLFSVPIDAAWDIGGWSHHLAFMDDQGHFIRRELTLQTNQTGRTAIAVNSPLANSFYTYRARWYRRLLRWRKFFVLEYTAMVGTARYFVATLY